MIHLSDLYESGLFTRFFWTDFLASLNLPFAQRQEVTRRWTRRFLNMFIFSFPFFLVSRHFHRSKLHGWAGEKMFRFKEFSAATLQRLLSEIERERSCRAQVPDDRFAASFASHYCCGDGTMLISDWVKHYLWGLQPILKFIGLKWTFMKCTFNSSPLLLCFTCISGCIVRLTLGIRTETGWQTEIYGCGTIYSVGVKSTNFFCHCNQTTQMKRLLHNEPSLFLSCSCFYISLQRLSTFSLFAV